MSNVLTEPKWVTATRQKLDHLRYQEVIATDPDTKFKLLTDINSLKTTLEEWSRSSVQHGQSTTSHDSPNDEHRTARREALTKTWVRLGELRNLVTNAPNNSREALDTVIRAAPELEAWSLLLPKEKSIIDEIYGLFRKCAFLAASTGDTVFERATLCGQINARWGDDWGTFSKALLQSYGSTDDAKHESSKNPQCEAVTRWPTEDSSKCQGPMSSVVDWPTHAPQEVADSINRAIQHAQTTLHAGRVLRVVSSFGTVGYRGLGTDKRVSAVYHATGPRAGMTFTSSLGFGYVIRSRWMELEPILGFPVGDEYSVQYGSRANYEGGHLEWHADAKEVRVCSAAVDGGRYVSTVKLK